MPSLRVIPLLLPILLVFSLLGYPAAAPAEGGRFDRLVFEVDRSERRLYVVRGERIIRAHDVAVGQPDHPTPVGSWEIFQLDINPDWTPPDSEWAEDREYKPPGHPDNPMGRARLIFSPPYTIHGTDAYESLGRAASHGSIRVGNDVVLELAELVLREGRAWQSRQWFESMTGQPDRMFSIRLEDPVPIRVGDGKARAGD